MHGLGLPKPETLNPKPLTLNPIGFGHLGFLGRVNPQRNAEASMVSAGCVTNSYAKIQDLREQANLEAMLGVYDSKGPLVETPKILGSLIIRTRYPY